MKSVFFYGLFMDPDLLRDKGLNPGVCEPAQLAGYGLRIGARATLVKSESERACGSVIELDEKELETLYGDESVADYLPERVLASSIHGDPVPALCYILPSARLRGANGAYARSLAIVARKLDLPTEYIREIETWIK